MLTNIISIFKCSNVPKTNSVPVNNNNNNNNNGLDLFMKIFINNYNIYNNKKFDRDPNAFLAELEQKKPNATLDPKKYFGQIADLRIIFSKYYSIVIFQSKYRFLLYENINTLEQFVFLGINDLNLFFLTSSGKVVSFKFISYDRKTKKLICGSGENNTLSFTPVRKTLEIDPKKK